MNFLSAKNVCSQETVQYIVKREIGSQDPLLLGNHILDTQCGIDNHYFDLLHLLVCTYYSIRQNHVARVHTKRMKNVFVRQKLTKIILFKGD